MVTTDSEGFCLLITLIQGARRFDDSGPINYAH
jgi:hypothetical protein